MIVDRYNPSSDGKKKRLSTNEEMMIFDRIDMESVYYAVSDSDVSWYANKHPSDNSLESSKVYQNYKRIIFDTTLSNKVIPLNTPRIAKADREKLSRNYIFRMQSIEENATVVQSHQNKQQSICSLIEHHSGFLDILERTLLARIMLICLIMSIQILILLTQDNQDLYRIMKHTLLDFSSKCFRCEKTIKSMQTTSSLAVDIQGASFSFADGLGYSTLVGHMDDERVVFEASSGGVSEDQSRTQDDALKWIKVLTSILVLKAYDLKNAWFETFKNYIAISVQVIKRKTTLSVLSMDKEKKFVFEKR
ncbi:hypothetical protein EDC96DRAFT_548069 [Choanephora cucurbitarum]|nr:hypothetical protein EDC96DRAFT_548069 [Choanephora cucurbitarum]